MARREFKVKWAEDLRGAKGGAISAEKEQVHRMRMLRHMLDAGGWILDHTDPDGYQIYIQVEAQ